MAAGPGFLAATPPLAIATILAKLKACSLTFVSSADKRCPRAQGCGVGDTLSSEALLELRKGGLRRSGEKPARQSCHIHHFGWMGLGLVPLKLNE